MFPFEIWADPQRIHAAVVHLPVALALLGIPLVYLTAVSNNDKDTLRWLTIASYAALIALALLGQWTGERARDQVPTNMAPAVYDRLEQHEEMAEKTWMLAAGTAVLVAFSTLRIRWFRTAMISLAMVASIATGAWVAVTGHLGGDLVYSYGVGTPGKALNRPAPPQPAPPPPPPPAPVAVTPPPAPAAPAPVPAPPAPAPAPAPEATVTPAPEATPVAPPPAPTVEATPVTPPAAALVPEPAPVPAPADVTPLTPPADQQPVPSLAIRPIVPEEAAKVSYVKDVKPIFEKHCIDCHDVDSPKGGLALDTVADMMKAGKKSGPGVIPFKPDDSSVVQYIRGLKQPQMPRKRPPLTEDELHTVRMWINAGAVDDSAPAEQPAPPAETGTHPTDNAPVEAGKPAIGTLVAWLE
jgi:uncharacterized membrane protein